MATFPGRKDCPYRQAAELGFDIQEAVATANPFRVAMLTYASEFLY